MHRFSIHAILWMTTLFACGACAIRWQQAEYRAAKAKVEIDALKYQLAAERSDTQELLGQLSGPPPELPTEVRDAFLKGEPLPEGWEVQPLPPELRPSEHGNIGYGDSNFPSDINHPGYERGN